MCVCVCVLLGVLIGNGGLECGFLPLSFFFLLIDLGFMIVFFLLTDLGFVIVMVIYIILNEVVKK